ncbi:MAG: carbohydrate kinase family protein [Bacteroidetes bacterium]|nr:carbohydrate kinase family protein [Bacteroidota bacterium]MCL6101210.1 carbohydrate kinase family protein [Bacteroidota bacterium]
MTDIVCVGILVADVLGKTVNSFPEKGKLALVDRMSLQIGGCAANVVIDLAKLGLGSTIIGKIGDDNFGKFLLETLNSNKVNISGLKLDNNVSTSASMVMISSDGERSILHSFGANAKFCFDDINLDIIKKSKILLIAGTFLMPDFDGEGTRKLLKFAKENGVLCCMDTAWDSTGEWLNKIEPSLEYLDWFMPSYDEAVEMSGKTKHEGIAQFFYSKGVRNVIVKLGSEGCYVKPENEDGYTVVAFNKVKAIDTSGAGDSFCAGFIAGLYKGWKVQKCAEFANAVGAHCIMQIGTTTGIKSIEEVLRFISDYEFIHVKKSHTKMNNEASPTHILTNKKNYK